MDIWMFISLAAFIILATIIYFLLKTIIKIANSLMSLEESASILLNGIFTYINKNKKGENNDNN